MTMKCKGCEKDMVFVEQLSPNFLLCKDCYRNLKQLPNEIRCKVCREIVPRLKILEHAAITHNDKDAAQVLEELNKFRGT